MLNPRGTMFLLGGVLAPLVHPRPAPGWAKPRPADPLPLPAALETVLEGAVRAPGRSALRGETAFLMDRTGRGALAVRTHLGCLVASGDPVGDSAREAELVAQFVALARGGGRVPVVRNARREALALYGAHGLRARAVAPEAVLSLRELSLGALEPTEAWGVSLTAEERGAVLEVLPRPWAVAALPDLRRVDPSLAASELRRVKAAVVRVAGRVVAFTLYREGAPGGEVCLERIRAAGDVPDGTLAFLVTRLALRLRCDGYARLLLGAPSALRASTPALAALLRELPVSMEPRFMVRPRGWKGLWAQVALRGLSGESDILA